MMYKMLSINVSDVHRFQPHSWSLPTALAKTSQLAGSQQHEVTVNDVTSRMTRSFVVNDDDDDDAASVKTTSTITSKASSRWTGISCVIAISST